tara:strand:+ start:259 stop:498 length:240 start_codon:yes stop_codon:yes gene_type:complete
MDLKITELSEVCSVLRTYISQSKRVNKKNRIKEALKKLEIQLAFEESKFTVQKSRGRLTFRKNNLCPHCHQPKLTSTLK